MYLVSYVLKLLKKCIYVFIKTQFIMGFKKLISPWVKLKLFMLSFNENNSLRSNFCIIQ